MIPKLQRYLREHSLVRAGERVGVAVSGGADSTALLRALLELQDELGIVLSVVHLNHHLRPEADADQEFVTDMARRFGLVAHVASRDVAAWASAHKLGLEAAGRKLRYEFFRSLVSDGTLDKVATAHTLDDQAETVLLRLLRGAGTRGMAGVYRSVREGGPTGGARARSVFIRPLLSTTRRQVEEYLHSIGQHWREDGSNQDMRYLRNRVRHQLLPMLEAEFNPGIRQVLAETAEIAAEEESDWMALVAARLPAIASPPPASADAEGNALLLDVRGFAAHSVALQRRLLRRFIAPCEIHLDFEHLERLRRWLLAAECGTLELPSHGVAVLERTREGALHLRLHLRPLGAAAEEAAANYEYALPVPGEVDVPETGLHFRARVINAAQAREGYNPTLLLDRSATGESLTIRNWRPGERYHPKHRSGEEKLKRLLQEAHVPAGERAAWPVVTASERVVWVRGLNVAQEFALLDGATEALLIECSLHALAREADADRKTRGPMSKTSQASPQVILTAEQIQGRVRELARRVSEDYRGRTIYAVAVLENAFVFMGDLIRHIEGELLCQFVKPFFREVLENNIATTEIFFSPELEVAGQHVLLVEGVLTSGVTTEFLVRNFQTRGAASVKICTLLDRQSQRRVSLQPDYFGFLLDDTYVMGYGLGSPDFDRNLPFIAASPRVPADYARQLTQSSARP